MELYADESQKKESVANALTGANNDIELFFSYQWQWRIQAVWETDILVWAPKFWRPKNTSQVFFFQLYFNRKYVEVVMNDFTMHLITSKWLRRQKCKQKRHNKKRSKRKKEMSTKCFHSFKYVIDYGSVRFFFYFNSFVWFVLYYLLHLSTLDCFVVLKSL